jgi:hypothetical protein
MLPATPTRRLPAHDPPKPPPPAALHAWSSPTGSDCFSDDMTVASPEHPTAAGAQRSLAESLLAQSSPSTRQDFGAPQLLENPGASAAQRALLHRLAGVVRAVHAAHRLTDHHCDLLAADVERLERTLRAPDPQSKEPADVFVDDDDEEEVDLVEEKRRGMREAEKKAEMEAVVERVMAVRGEMEQRIGEMKVSISSKLALLALTRHSRSPTRRKGGVRRPRRPSHTCATSGSAWRLRTRASRPTTAGTAPR